MSRRFAKVSEEEIKTAFFYPSDLVNTKTTIPLRVDEERWIYIPRRFASRYISTTIHLPLLMTTKERNSFMLKKIQEFAPSLATLLALLHISIISSILIPVMCCFAFSS